MGLRLPATGMHHTLPVAWFALCCLVEDINRHHRSPRRTP